MLFVLVTLDFWSQLLELRRVCGGRDDHTGASMHTLSCCSTAAQPPMLYPCDAQQPIRFQSAHGSAMRLEFAIVEPPHLKHLAPKRFFASSSFERSFPTPKCDRRQ